MDIKIIHNVRQMSLKYFNGIIYIMYVNLWQIAQLFILLD